MRRTATVLAWAVLIASAACSRDNPNQQTVTYEGCVQTGAGIIGTGYLLTMLEEPAGAVGTSGSVTSTGSAIEREQMRLATQMYRLDAKSDDVDLGKMVGKLVRVPGVVSEHSDLPNGAGAIGSSLDTQLPNRDRDQQDSRGPQISTSDLGRIDVTSARVIGNSCSSNELMDSGKTNGAMAGTDRNPRVIR
jgi:hypothetical protein